MVIKLLMVALLSPAGTPPLSATKAPAPTGIGVAGALRAWGKVAEPRTLPKDGEANEDDYRRDGEKHQTSAAKPQEADNRIAKH